MVVSARVSRQAGATIEAVLVDLSVGGCRVSLAAGEAELPEVGERIAVTLAFPNVDDELSRRLWFYTCGIDREAVCRRQLRDETRRLAPSRLFRPAGLRRIGPNRE